MRRRTPPSPRRPAPATWWLVLLSVVSLSWTAAALATPVRELPRFLSSSKYQSLRSLETQESSSRVPETRIRGSEFRGEDSHQENRRLKLELIGLFEFAYGRKASDALELSRDPIGFQGGLNLYAYTQNNPINFRDPLGLDTTMVSPPVAPTGGRVNLPGPTGTVDPPQPTNYELAVSATGVAASGVAAYYAAPYAVRALQLHAGYRAGTALGTSVGDAATYAADPTAENGRNLCNAQKAKTLALSLIAAAVASRLQNPDPVRFHHPWPKYVGGPEQQLLEPLPLSLHIAYHRGLSNSAFATSEGLAGYEALTAAEQAAVLRDVAAYTAKFDATHGTFLLDAMRREGFPY